MTEKVLCPWCGAEMQLDQQLFIAFYVCSKCRARGPVSIEGSEAAKAAALRRYTPPLKPLTPMTLEEVWKEEDPVWVEGKNGALYIGDFYASMSAKNGWDVQTLGSAKPQLILEDDYGKNWRCWSRKPTDEERSAAEWKD